MDATAYWQENKRFVGRVAAGVLAFLAGVLVVDALWAGDVALQERRLAQLQRELREPLHDASARDAVAGENAALREAVAELAAAVRFEPRPAFRLEGAEGSASNRYLRALDAVRERLLRRANRANLEIDPGLGMPELSPTREAEIERYLEALDVVETVAELAIEAGARRLRDVRVRLDPGLSSRTGLGRVERTRVELSVLGSSRAVARVLAWTQRPDARPGASDGDEPAGRVLLVDSAEVVPSRREGEGVRLDLVLVVARFDARAAVGGG